MIVRTHFGAEFSRISRNEGDVRRQVVSSRRQVVSSQCRPLVVNI